mmetsp:Transcript_1175/g.1479  ORF Transcript_1175/g.1479 Transcript_1175/m.1479 type:complete len:131 (+) Transcript_1175:76-468(+)
MDDGRAKMQISFDDANRIRILEADMFKQTESLAQESTGFVKKIESFNKIVTQLLTVLTAQSEKIERAKLLAIGQKNKNRNEKENCRRIKKELQTQIILKRQELERIRIKNQSLEKTVVEQRQIIERFKTN